MRTRKLTVESFLQLGGRAIRAKRSSLEIAKAAGLAIVVHVAGRGVEYHRFSCPGGCGRNCRRVYFRDGRWGCRRCQRLVYRSTQQAHRVERAMERFEQCGRDPMRLPEWVLIVLAGMPD